SERGSYIEYEPEIGKTKTTCTCQLSWQAKVGRESTSCCRHIECGRTAYRRCNERRSCSQNHSTRRNIIPIESSITRTRSRNRCCTCAADSSSSYTRHHRI